MRYEDVKIGMKVVPHSKSVGVYSRGSYMLAQYEKKGLKFLYVTKKRDDFCVLNVNKEPDGSGDFFLSSDFEPYIEPLKVTKARRAGIDLFDPLDRALKNMSVEKEKANDKIPEVHKIIFHGTATVILWKDGTATVANLMHGDKYESDIGVQVCYTKKMFGSIGKFRKKIKDNMDTTYSTKH